MGEEKVEIAELASHLWRDRKLIAKITGVFVICGILIALLSPVEYQTSAVVMPEIQSSESTAGSLLERYGGMLGISAPGDLGNINTIPPQLYPKIIESIPYQLELMQQPLTFQRYDTTLSAYTFFEEIYSPTIFSHIKEYTLGLPGKVAGLFKENKIGKNNVRMDAFSTDSIYVLSEEQKEIMEGMRERIQISQDEESGIVTLTASMPDPRAAGEIGKAALDLLKEQVRTYRTKKLAEDLEFIRQQVERARNEFEKAQNRLAEFRDSNISLTSARAKTELQELQSQYDLTFNLYNSLRQQLEQEKIKVQKSTPVFSILQPVSQPLEKSEPQTILIILVSLILGFILAMAWSLIRVWWVGLVQDVKGMIEGS